MADPTDRVQENREPGGDEAPPTMRTELDIDVPIVAHSGLEQSPEANPSLYACNPWPPPAGHDDGGRERTTQGARHETGSPAAAMDAFGILHPSSAPRNTPPPGDSASSESNTNESDAAGLREDVLTGIQSSSPRDDITLASNQSMIQSTIPSGYDPTPPPPSLDLADYIPGMYRILDLVSDQGSGGLVDKIIISQDSFGRFVNDTCPSAYRSMTNVNFNALDQFIIQPVGIYGSKSEIVRFLKDRSLIDDELARLLLDGKDETIHTAQRSLRSGLYLIRDCQRDVVYALYWPQDTTWHDDAISSIARNRTTFMRYLTKIADQILVLISGEHASGIVWEDIETPDEMVDDDDDSDRLFTFQVAKTHEQEENVTMKPGFEVQHPTIKATDVPEGCPVDPEVLRPRLISGDSCSGIMTVTHEPENQATHHFKETYSTFRLEQLVGKESFRLHSSLSEESLEALAKAGIAKHAPEPFQVCRARREAARQALQKEETENFAELNAGIRDQHDAILDAIRMKAIDVVTQKYDALSTEALCEALENPKFTDNTQGSKLLATLMMIHPKLTQDLDGLHNEPKLKSIDSKSFKVKKGNVLKCEAALSALPSDSSPERQSEIVDAIQRGKDLTHDASGVLASVKDAMVRFIPGGVFVGQGDRRRDSSESGLSNTEFFLQLPAITDRFPVLAELVNDTVTLVNKHFSRQVDHLAHQIVRGLENLQRGECNRQLKAKRVHVLKTELDLSRQEYLLSVVDSFIREPKQFTVVENIQVYRAAWNRDQYLVTGERHTHVGASLKYTIRPLQLTEADKQSIQLEPGHVPKPRPSNTAYTFNLLPDRKIVHCQLLQQERCLLIISDHLQNLFVFLARLADIDAAVAAGRRKKELKAEKIGQQPLITFDETKRLLALCSSEKPTLHTFLFDENFTSLDGYGTPIDLQRWYTETQVVIKHIALKCGQAEELLVVDETGRARVFSLAAQSFRPAFVQLGNMPSAVTSSPDGSCAFTVEHHAGGVVLQAYHWATFGSSGGICLEVPDMPCDSWTVTSFAQRTVSKCHFISVDVQDHLLKSVMLEITHKSTEFTFKADSNLKASGSGSYSTTAGHNAFLSCHREVWTRFPVVPAVRRQTVKSSDRRDKSLTFVSQLPQSSFRRQYDDMVTKFESAVRKPIGSELSAVQIRGLAYEDLSDNSFRDISRFKAGEWLVDILCLIPIHLAVTRDNRFVPLKDGVWSVESEQSLLGATVDQVVDSLSFGWYESIFQSYMSNKSVKVVSSMGEQSVGKSFALNHLVDTSFAGSAMRTTEGVWMAVTPTDDALIVALDFEGVHSIERTAQEDSLLVLFNTAISNLVLFRNNFALSRDITSLFQSFQSSSTVLDPAANPSLFKSTLVIIIKDVVDSDKVEIKKEFALKFQRIVEVEQDANFISRLHGGNLAIIPWPVIESRQFYTLFPTVKKMLDKQMTTHPTAGVFLQTMKTLMAKLKTNDWGSIDQNLASHRAQRLQSLLPQAFALGALELEPVFEPLKDFDSGAAIDLPDSAAKFFVQSVNDALMEDERKRCLTLLCTSWPNYNTRFDECDASDAAWVDKLYEYLEDQAALRLQHVRAWVDVNTSRFKSDVTNFTDLHREFENTAVALKANIRLCKLQCATCRLACLLPRHHEGAHDCQTSHQCPQQCSFADDHADAVRSCGMPAGHPGNHVCEVALHLCGQPCRLSGKGGCLERCVKIVDHADDEHLCQARAHECGAACDLADVRLSDESRYSCGELCCVSSEEPHDVHCCKERSCPIKCQLCNRLCANTNHLHGLLHGALHLCGAEHTCRSLCQAEGICKIETAPQSINATFTGRHETFQYTKYTQVAKSLQCAIVIPPGQVQHEGQHIHELGANAFHFCKAQCDHCGYYCTLPLGHRQAYHETSHGSMSKTQWAVNGPDGTVLEVNGHKFASNDDGAPMLCSMVCRSLGRHAHIDYCRSEDPAACRSAELSHISARMTPNPARAKDWISHDLFWRRSGFRDPYSQDDRNDFAKCDAMCAGPEHQADANGPAQPSYCNLSIFHAQHAIGTGPPGGVGYISGDGHHFLCRNPAQLHQAFHVIFVIDRSGSMAGADRRPLDGTPVTAKIRAQHNNRVGAVYSSLYAFWLARHAALNAGATRRDAYSVILFDSHLHTAVNHDFSSPPDALLDQVMPHGARGGTNFDMALREAQRNMQTHWSTERAPVVIFLSDGECNVTDSVMRDLCRQAVALGKPLSFHAVAFGPSNQYLRRMNTIATEVQRNVAPDPMHPVVACSYTEALDSIRLAETFLGIADSLTKPRGALMHA